MIELNFKKHTALFELFKRKKIIFFALTHLEKQMQPRKIVWKQHAFSNNGQATISQQSTNYRTTP